MVHKHPVALPNAVPNVDCNATPALGEMPTLDTLPVDTQPPVIGWLKLEHDRDSFGPISASSTGEHFTETLEVVDDLDLIRELEAVGDEVCRAPSPVRLNPASTAPHCHDPNLKPRCCLCAWTEC